VVDVDSGDPIWINPQSGRPTPPEMRSTRGATLAELKAFKPSQFVTLDGLSWEGIAFEAAGQPVVRLFQRETEQAAKVMNTPSSIEVTTPDGIDAVPDDPPSGGTTSELARQPSTLCEPPGDRAAVLPAKDQSAARFTCLRYIHPVGKRFMQDQDGALRKETLADGTQATAHIVTCTSIEQLAAAFRDATECDIFVGGVPVEDNQPVVTKSKRSQGSIARTKEDLPFPDGSGVMFLDNDLPQGDQEDQFEVFVLAVPELRAASYVHSPSSSAWIFDANGRQLKGAGGQHYAIPVLDASDIPRALNALHLRLLMAEKGEPVVTKAGTIRMKSPADTAMQSSNQPLFQRVSLGPGLEQRKRDRVGTHRGDVFLFDTRQIRDLDDVEHARLKAIKAAAMEKVVDQAAAAREAYIAVHAPRVAGRTNRSLEYATEALRSSLTATGSNFDLFPGQKLQFGCGEVDVAEVLANPTRFHGQSCADPLEPEYGSSIGVAKFFANAGGKPLVHSFAHGGQKFFLQNDLSGVDLTGILGQAQGWEAGQEAEGSRPPGDSANEQAQAGPEGSRTGPSGPERPYPSDGPGEGAGGPQAGLERYLVNIEDVAICADDPHQHVIAGIVPEGEVTLCAGHGGSGKSFIWLMLAALVAHAESIGPIQVQRRRVLFFSAEDDEATLKRRLGRICRTYGIAPRALQGWLFMIDASELDPTLYLPLQGGQKHGPTQLLNEVAELVEKHEIGLTILDNASDLFAGNEIMRAEVRGFIRAIRQRLARPDRAVVLLAHVAKIVAAQKGVRGDEDYSGSSAWHNSARSRLTIEQTADPLRVVMHHRKANRGPLVSSISFDWVDGVPVMGGCSGIPGAELAASLVNEAQRKRNEQDMEVIVALIVDFNVRDEHVTTSNQGGYTVFKTLQGTGRLPKGMTSERLIQLIRQLERSGRLIRQQSRRNSKDREGFVVQGGSAKPLPPNSPIGIGGGLFGGRPPYDAE
jgi:energy-coupling factor transporter ATP-binding protein EcfA2